MDNALTSLFSWEFILFSLAMFAITWVIRTIVELSFPKIINNKWWNKAFLPLFPTILGVVITHFAISYPYPDGLTSLSGREMFGLVAGSLSSSIYQVLKGVLKERIQSFIGNQTTNNSVSGGMNNNGQ